ncbi:MAG: DNA polymerase III subunit alpha [Deltaproteobacteria bacterium]|nr:DNA polymerase III subunit alpha [Deltaproteobacteria bacterium]
MSFVHLHVHSEYSFVDGSIRIPQLIAHVKNLGHTHLALTDHSKMHGAMEFYQKAKEAGIIPIVGCEVFFRWQDSFYQLVLLAKNQQGYKNLLRIVSSAYVGDLNPDAPVICSKTLRENASDLVAISSFSRGAFSEMVKVQNKLSLSSFVEQMRALFSEDFYVEITDNDLPGQKELARKVVETAQELSVDVVATANAHYLTKDFAETHALAVAIKNSLTLADIRNRLANVHLHVMDNEEMAERFRDYPFALENTLKIAEKCSQVHIPTGKYYLPRIKLHGNESAEQTLRRLAEKGLKERGSWEKEEYRKRLFFELDVIANMGFPDYFLIVQDFIAWAKRQGIPVGPGRGSGAGSLVAYALQITDLDPLPYNLIFERFLNPERVSLPDFDIDFCQWRRDEVIQYCVKTYGKQNVAQITTFGKLNAKGVVKAVGRAMNLGFNRVDQFTKLFPMELGITLQQALDQEPRIREEMEKDDSLRDCMDQAMKLEGLSSHTSVHAAGVVISDGDMTNYVPIYTTDGASYITQYEMKPTEKAGLVKFDFLGLKTLTVIDQAVKLVRQRGMSDFAIETIPLDNAKVFAMLSQGHTVGVFQCESSGMTQLIRKLKPSTFEDIIALVALFRPGPLGSGMVDDFVKRKHGQQKISYLHPDLEPILKDTYGMILYQEQVQKTAAVLAHYSLGEADLLRRAMGKKIPEEMAQQKERFLSGAEQNKIPRETAEEIFDLMAEFAKYGFNKSHSATYGLLSYQTAYLKCYYPECYLAACLTCDKDNTDKLVRYAEECRRLGIKLLTPHINRSGLTFQVPQEGEVDFALSAIKGMGEGPLLPVLEEREKNGPFKSLTELATRVHLGKFGKKTLQLLIYSGALDGLNYSRQVMDAMVPSLVAYSTDLHDASSSGQRSLFTSSGPRVKEPNWVNDQSFPPLKKGEKGWDIRDLFWERKLLGNFLTHHPLSFFRQDVENWGSTKLGDLAKLGEKQGKHKVSVLALLGKLEFRRSKKGSLMAYVRLEQEDDTHEGIMFSSALEGKTLPPANSFVLAEGTIERMNEEMPARFNIETLIPVESIRRERVKSLLLTLNGKEDEPTPQALQSLRRILEKHPGNTPLRAQLALKDCKVRLSITHRRVVLSDAFIQDLSKIHSLSFTYI